MFRRGRYQQIRDAEAKKEEEDEDKNNQLAFVGTSSELVSPHLHHLRRSPHYQNQSYNNYSFEQQHQHRQGAGKDEPKTPISTVATAASKTSKNSTPKGIIPSDDQLTNVIGILYFMSWTRKALKNYSNDIRKLYEIPLTERCFGKLSESNSINSTEESIITSDSRNAAKETAKRLEKGCDVTETFTDLALIQKRLADALKNPQADLFDNRAETPRHLTTPIEVACLSRLRTLVKISGSWLKKTVEMEAWMEKNQKVLVQHATEIACGLEFAIMGFNAVCVLGEVYGLEAVDRKSVKKDFVRYLEQYERPKLREYNAKLNIPESVKVIDYIGKLEAKLNHHRTTLHIIGSSTISVFQIILKSLPTEILETTTRSLREVAHKLPSSFRFYEDLKLSSFASNFLSTPPPNSIEFSFAELEHQHSTTTTEASTPIIVKSQQQRQQSRKSSHETMKSDHTQRSGGGSRKSSVRSPATAPEVPSARSNSTQRSSPSNKSPPTARNIYQ